MFFQLDTSSNDSAILRTSLKSAHRVTRTASIDVHTSMAVACRRTSRESEDQIWREMKTDALGAAEA